MAIAIPQRPVLGCYRLRVVMTSIMVAITKMVMIVMRVHAQSGVPGSLGSGSFAGSGGRGNAEKLNVALHSDGAGFNSKAPDGRPGAGYGIVGGFIGYACPPVIGMAAFQCHYPHQYRWYCSGGSRYQK